jgi:hypothetical protein
MHCSRLPSRPRPSLNQPVAHGKMRFGRRYGSCEERQSEVLALSRLGREFYEPCRRELDGGGGNRRGEVRGCATRLQSSMQQVVVRNVI